MSKHTPTPWKAERIRAIPVTNSFEVIARDEEGKEFKVAGPLTIERAEHIVRCVNSYEAMQEALKSVGMFVHEILNDEIQPKVEDYNHALTYINAALQLANP